MTRLAYGAACAASLMVALSSCGGSSDDGGSSASSGGAGASTSSGGSAGTGALPAGGTTAMGGATAAGGTPGAGGLSPTGQALQTFVIGLVTAACNKVYECCTPEERAANPFYGETAEQCALALGAFMSLALPILQQSIDSGRLVFHSDQSSGCLTQYSSTDCAALRSGDSADLLGQCETIFEPQVPLGGACAQDGECIGGYCEGATTDTDGECTAKKSDTIECSNDDECQSDYCDSGSGTCAPNPGDEPLCGGG